MRNPKFRYVWKHKETGNIRSDVLAIENIEATLWPARLMEEYDLIARDLFTDKTDKNSREVYEGDRVETASMYKGVIEWHEGGFWIKVTEIWKYEARFYDVGQFMPLDYEPFEVIGNIYE